MSLEVNGWIEPTRTISRFLPVLVNKLKEKLTDKGLLDTLNNPANWKVGKDVNSLKPIDGSIVPLDVCNWKITADTVTGITIARFDSGINPGLRRRSFLLDKERAEEFIMRSCHPLLQHIWDNALWKFASEVPSLRPGGILFYGPPGMRFLRPLSHFSQ